MNFGERLAAAIEKAGVRVAASVPDNWIEPVIERLNASAKVVHTPAAREEDALGICLGAALAGRRAVCLMQNAGLLNTGGTLATLANAFGVPVVLIVTDRGHLGDVLKANLALPQLRNAGPCPYVKVLYDAARYVELKDNQEAPAAVGFTGEIEALSSACEYKSDQPIKVQARLLFGLGRGPQAAGDRKTYRYWVAVTDRDHAVIDKAYFDLPVTFPAGRDRVEMIQDVFGISIPRADIKVSGSNFEVLIGFDVTPQMADFNRLGKRFRPNVDVDAKTAQASAPRTP